MHAYWFITIDTPFGYGVHVTNVLVQSSKAPDRKISY